MTGTFAGTGLLWNSDGLLFNTDNYITVPHSPLQNPTEITFFSVTIPNVQVAGGTLVGKGLGSGYRIVFNSTYISIYDRGTTNTIDSPGIVYANIRYSIGIDMGVLGLSIYINGKREATGGTTFLGNTTTAEFRISNYSYSDYFKGDIKCLYMYGRILSPTEHQQLHLSPYQFIRPVVPMPYYMEELAYPLYSRSYFDILPTTASRLDTIYSAQDYTDVETDDGVRVSQSSLPDEYAVHQFKERLRFDDDAITLNWNGQSTVPCSLATVYLQAYNHTTGVWDTVDSDSSTAKDTDNLI